MTVTLPADLQAFVDEQVAAGAAAEVNEAVAEAVRALQKKKDEVKLAALIAKFDEAEAEVAAGKVIRNPVSAKDKLAAIRRRLEGE